MAKHTYDSQKADLRSEIRAQRADQARNTQRQAELTAHLGSLVHAYPRIIAYAALPGEPNLDAALDAAHAAGADIFLPAAGPVGTPLRFGRLTGTMSSLKPQGSWGIREPQSEFSAPEVLAGTSAASPVLLLAPGLGYGKAGARLGNGGGYYDRTFGPLGQCPLTDFAAVTAVGVCFAEEFGIDLTAADWDLRVQAVVTDNGIEQI